MSKTRLAVLAGMALAVIFGIGLLVGIVLPRMAGLGSAPRTYNTAVLLRQVQTLSQLVTVKYVLEKVVILEDPPQNPVRRLLPDETRVILVAHGIVKAGVDLSRLKNGDLKLSGNRIEITLPPAQITDSYLDDTQTKVIERNTSFLRDFNKDLEQNARQTAVDDIRRAAKSSGILKDADERARAQLRLLFEELGFEVEFR
jgi:hypothetical protein